jgi:outer membrane protein OmpA-like peptidoglycan-associated protein
VSEPSEGPIPLQPQVAGIEVAVYDRTGRTRLAVLNNARDVQWQHELSSPGNATFELPLDDPKTALVTTGRIVKFSYFGAERFGCVITDERATLAVDGSRWVRWENQPGIAAIMSRAVVYPEYGISRVTGTDRLFGFMSKGPALGMPGWWPDNEWITNPPGYMWRDDTSKRKGVPVVFDQVDRKAKWISYAGPNVPRPAGSSNYFRENLHIESDIAVTMYFAADAYYTVYLDGEQVIAPDYDNAVGWNTAQSYVTTLTKGDHVLAVRVENYKAGPIAFICTIINISTETGKPAPVQQTETLAGDVTFAFDSDALTGAARTAIRAIVNKATGSAPHYTVVGHTDSDGSVAYNLDLSRRRAQSVANYIKSVDGAASVSIGYFGESKPVASNATAAGRAKNRRVEITYPHSSTPDDSDSGDVDSGVSFNVVRRSDHKWIAHDRTPPVGWSRASVLRQLVIEGQARNVLGFKDLVLGYDDDVDSAGSPWVDRGEYSFSIASGSVLDIAQQLSEVGLDWDVDAATMTLKAWVRAGNDRTQGDSPVMLWLGRGIRSAESTQTHAVVTDIIAHLADNSWQETADASAVFANGRIEAGVESGSTLTPATGKALALAMLSETAYPTITFTAETTPHIGPQPYRDYVLGDTINVPGHRGVGRMAARVLSITVDATGDDVRTYPEVVIDRSSSIIAIAGEDGSVWSLYADVGGNLSIDPAPIGVTSAPVSFVDGSHAWVLVVGEADELSLVPSGAGVYSKAKPLTLPTPDPSVLLAVWVENEMIVTEERR